MSDEDKVEGTDTESAEPQSFPCPHCKETIYPRLAAYIPKRQKVSFKIEYKGECLAAMTLGGTITNFAELMKQIAKDIGGKVEVFIEAVDYRPHEVTVDFLITNVKGDE